MGGMHLLVIKTKECNQLSWKNNKPKFVSYKDVKSKTSSVRVEKDVKRVGRQHNVHYSIYLRLKAMFLNRAHSTQLWERYIVPFFFTISSIYTCLFTMELSFHYRTLSINPNSTSSILCFTFKFLQIEKPSIAVSFSKKSLPMWDVKGIRGIRI